MSLKVWLPLIDNLDNKGTMDVSVVNNGATVDTSNAKLGSSYKFNGTNQYISVNDYYMPACEGFSIAFWYYSSNTTPNRIFCLKQSIGYVIFSFGVGKVNYRDNTSSELQGFTVPETAVNQWTHCAFVYNNGSLFAYYDGELVFSNIGTPSNNTKIKEHNRLTVGAYPASGTLYYFNGNINDFRIYDHALSKAEVKELSHALISHYKLDDIQGTVALDSSGYGHHGTTKNTVNLINGSGRYDKCVQLPNGNSCIDVGKWGNIKDQMTINFWVKSITGKDVAILSNTQNGGYSFYTGTDYAYRFSCYSSGYKNALSQKEFGALNDGKWHMVTGVWDVKNKNIRIYTDGILDGITTTPGNNMTFNGTAKLYLAAEATASSFTSGCTGYFSDLRIYATAFSDADVLDLYQSCTKVMKDGFGAYTLSQAEGMSVNKDGIASMQEFSEFTNLEILKYDSKVYIESDGSTWVHVCHHNSPSTNGVFNSDDDFANSVYLDENRWFDMRVCNYLSSWEIMVKETPTADGTEYIARWIQNVNPMTASYNDVGSVTWIQTTGYTQLRGGLFKQSDSGTYLSCRGKNAYNWYCAIGAYGLWNGGVPALTGTVCTTGCIDAYLRIDNLQLNNATMTKFYKNKLLSSNNLIEI